jgi:hypothetical protein
VLVCPSGADSSATDVSEAPDTPADGPDESAVTDATGDDGALETSVTDAESEGGPAPGPEPQAEGGGTLATPPEDSGCHSVNVNPPGGACSSLNLVGSSTVVDGSSAPIATPTGDDGSTGDDATTPLTFPSTSTSNDEGGVTLSGGGISQIGNTFKAGEIDDRSATQLTLTGLTNGAPYVVVVATLDGSGNVGPPSTPQCATPSAVSDFFARYRGSGGQSGGSCALEAGVPLEAPVFGIAIAAAAAALLRRRRR